MTLELSPDLYDLLDRLAAEVHGTKSDVLRMGVALLEIAVKARAEGKPFGIGHIGQDLATEIVGV